MIVNQFEKLFFLIAVITSYSFAGSHVDPMTPTNNLPFECKIVFSDEFNSSEIDTDKWNIGINKNNIQNFGVDCVYRWENVSIRQGNLVLMQKFEPSSVKGKVWGNQTGIDFSYSSGGLNTEGIFNLENNMYVEICIKLPNNPGGYAAFWGMANRNDPIVQNRVELDFFEYIANQKKRKFWSGLWWHEFAPDEVADYVSESDRYYRTPNHIFIKNQKHRAHFQSTESSYVKNINFDKYIKFGFLVTDKKMGWFVCDNGYPLENKPYLIFKGGEVHSPAHSILRAREDKWIREIPNPLQSSLIINYAMRSANWAGGPIDHEKLPAEMLVDYIRVYQL
jgi:hypothetical protein